MKIKCDMRKPNAFIGALLTLIPLGQPLLLIKTGLVLSNTAIMLSVPENVYARDYYYYFNLGLGKAKKGDQYGAISDFTKAIEIFPSENAYYNRAWSKQKIEDYYGAISDYTKAIEINPSNEDAYINRGIAKRKLKDYYGAISDYQRVKELNPTDMDPYLYSSIAKEFLGDIKGACFDAKKAISLGDNDPKNLSWIKKNC